jgi:hypothetical protein
MVGCTRDARLRSFIFFVNTRSLGFCTSSSSILLESYHPGDGLFYPATVFANPVHKFTDSFNIQLSSTYELEVDTPHHPTDLARCGTAIASWFPLAW